MRLTLPELVALLCAVAASVITGSGEARPSSKAMAAETRSRSIAAQAAANTLTLVHGVAPASKASASPAASSATSAAFHSVLKKNIPLTPEEIRKFEQDFDKTQAAIHSQEPPVMQTRTMALNLAPGAPVPVIKVTPGYVSSVVFLDNTGSPWPITSVTVGDPRFFSVEAPKVKPRNVLTVAALGSHLASNIAVTLAGHTTPVMLSLETNPAQAAVLTALRANSSGPLAESPVFHTVGHANTTLLAFLDDVPPNGASELATQSKGITGWSYKNNLYVRTELTPVWPAWVATVTGEMGIKVYKLPNVSSILVVDNGVRHTIDFTRAPSAGTD